LQQSVANTPATPLTTPIVKRSGFSFGLKVLKSYDESLAAVVVLVSNVLADTQY